MTVTPVTGNRDGDTRSISSSPKESTRRPDHPWVDRKTHGLPPEKTSRPPFTDNFGKRQDPGQELCRSDESGLDQPAATFDQQLAQAAHTIAHAPLWPPVGGEGRTWWPDSFGKRETVLKLIGKKPTGETIRDQSIGCADRQPTLAPGFAEGASADTQAPVVTHCVNAR